MRDELDYLVDPLDVEAQAIAREGAVDQLRAVISTREGRALAAEVLGGSPLTTRQRRRYRAKLRDLGLG